MLHGSRSKEQLLTIVLSRLLAEIGEFAQAQVDRTRLIRVMNSIGGGNKIREFRERLAQAMNCFEVGFAVTSWESVGKQNFPPHSYPSFALSPQLFKNYASQTNQ
jgi:hypothetical protein